MLAVAVCRSCERADPMQHQLDALLTARYAPPHWARPG